MNPYNEPAFPSNISNAPDSLTCGLHQGMTLRDYFAGQALMGICANPDLSMSASMRKINPADCRNSFVKCSYLLADAMLEERNK